MHMVVIHKVRQNNTIRVKFIHKVSIVTTKLTMNDQIVGHTEYKIHLRSDLRVYCPTSEFSVRPQNLVSDLRI